MSNGNVKLRLILDVEFDPQGLTYMELEKRMYQVVRDATSNGTLTGDSPATVEHYAASVRQLHDPSPKRSMGKCPKCGSSLDIIGFCTLKSCPYFSNKDC